MAIPTFEVVYLVSGTLLADAHDNIFTYQTQDGRPLEIGCHFVVEWPETINDRCFNATANYHGPYRSELAAYIKLEERRAVLIWEEDAAESAEAARVKCDSAASILAWPL
jgi:hypothetical protein